MPAVEGRFHTYAQSADSEDLIASRDHRAFAGFSLGSVTTWMEFCYDSEYIRYFLPMSGACWYYGGYGNYYPEETCEFFEDMIEEHDLNVVYYQKEGGRHDLNAVQEYIYNALPLFFENSDIQ